ncbi:MAG: glycosyl transferase [Rhodospirillaceae bacterium]|jgi:UDP-N-acetylmuramyl pentapeptide phosphotransferase/UDP-N-acetylglucosamine-1-phosphate transferase|nr:glycosyl transferase [Rhodospirillaceae bacterium]|tara:strand:+ start:4815 stop:5834 length:1020 start_codon:yes stop_codon:yes gene_type:complete
MNWTLFAFVVVIVFMASFVGTGLILRLLKSQAILDHPNERSSHVTPTPKGGGIAVVAAVLTGWVGISWDTPAAAISLSVAAAALALAALSWLDDLKGLSPLWRLLGQGAAVAFVLASTPSVNPFFGGLLPGALDGLAAGLLWLWFINLFNFMDGIDGLAGVETAALGLGIALVAAVAGMSPAFVIYGLALLAGALGFLWWNWHPARIFLGDVGSVPLGFLIGWLLLVLAKNGHWQAALILPLYFLADTTITLVRRALRGEKVWRAHREHFYQQAVKRGLTHSQVVLHILWVDIILVMLAVAAANGWAAEALAGALFIVMWLLFYLGSGGRPQSTPGGGP